MLDMREIAALPGTSGNENAVCAYIREQLKNAPAVASVDVDRIGNFIVKLKGKQAAPHSVVLAAHMDEVGGIVTGITTDGYLRFDTVGGIVPAVLYARRVSVNGHLGVIGGKAMHQCSEKEKNSVPSVADMRIDIGADSKEEAEAIVRLGDEVIFVSEYTELGNDLFKAKALDAFNEFLKLTDEEKKNSLLREDQLRASCALEKFALISDDKNVLVSD